MSETGQNPAVWQVIAVTRHRRDNPWRAPLAGSRFYTASTQRIPQRSRLRRGFVPRSPITCRRGSNDSRRLDRRGELLLRVVRVDRVCGVWIGVRSVGSDRDRAAGDHPREHLLSPPKIVGTSFTGITDDQGPTRWRADGSSPPPTVLWQRKVASCSLAVPSTADGPSWVCALRTGATICRRCRGRALCLRCLRRRREQVGRRWNTNSCKARSPALRAQVGVGLSGSHE